MGKLRALHVRGDEYAAMTVANYCGLEEAYAAAEEDNGRWCEIEADGVYCEVRALVFEESDRTLISYIKAVLCDYDALKHEDIFILD